MGAGERRNESRRVRAPPHGKRSQLQTGDPSLGPRVQRADVVQRKTQTHCLVQKAAGFVQAEAQVGGAQLVHLSARAQARQGQRRIFAGGDDQMQLRRQVLHQKGKGLIHRQRIDLVEIVEDEDDRVCGGGNVVEQGRELRFSMRWLRGLQVRQRPGTNAWHYALQRGNQIGQKTGGIAIARIQGEPRDRPPATRGPCAEQRGLSKSGRGRNQGQLAVQAGIELRDEPGAENGIWLGRGPIEFGGEDGRCHDRLGTRIG